MNLNSRGTLHPRWIEAVQRPLDGFLNCELELYDVDMLDNGANYDWRTNTGANGGATILFTGPAQLQVYRFTLTMDAPAGSVDQVRSARFTIDHEDIAGVTVRKGQMVRVTSAPNDPSLEHYQYVVNSGFNSASSFRRTIECEVDMARVVE